MKQLLHTFLLCGSLLALASCGTDSLLPAPDADGNTPGEPDARPLITITADMGAGASTRTGHDDVTAEGVKVNWAEGDKFIIFSIDAKGKKAGESVFTLVAGEAGKASAAFEGTKPMEGVEYCICYPADVAFQGGISGGYIASLSMPGQKQTGNNSTAHLSKFDPMQGHPVTEGDFSKISFTTDATNHPQSGHRATLMRFDLTNIPLDLGTPERIVVGLQATAGFNGFHTKVEVGGDVLSSATAFTLSLDLDNVTAAGQRITAYMMIAPLNMMPGDALTITLEGSQKHYTFTSPTFSSSMQYKRGMRYIASAGVWTEAVIKHDGTASAGSAFTGGEGTEASPYLISTAKDLQLLIESVKDGTSFEGKYFKLTRNVNIAMASGKTWTSIGTTSGMPFKGHFDGNGHTISGEMKGGTAYFGFFGVVNGGTITNLHVSATVTGSTTGSSGAIVCNAESSTISYCTNTGAVSGSPRSGGIVAMIKGCTLINCTNTGSVTTTMSHAGGIIGDGTSSAIIGCANTGEITTAAASGKGSGGIAGMFTVPNGTNGTIYGCFNTGLIKGSSDMGAIVGKKDIGTTGLFFIDNCQYVLANGQATGLAACNGVPDNNYDMPPLCTDIATLNSTGVTALNAGITKWTPAAGLPVCYPFRANSDLNKSPAIALPASIGSIGNITDGGSALN